MIKATPVDSLGNLRTLKYAHSTAVESSEVIVDNGNVLVAANDAEISKDNVYIYRGRISLAKKAALAINPGDAVYYDPNASPEEAVKVKGMAAGSPAAGANTGNGTVTGEAANANAEAETFTFTCVATATNSGTFSVIGSKTGRMADAVVGSAYDNGFVAFTINDGGTDFALADSFTIAITQANTKIGICVEKALAADTEVVVNLNENN